MVSFFVFLSEGRANFGGASTSIIPDVELKW